MQSSLLSSTHHPHGRQWVAPGGLLFTTLSYDVSSVLCTSVVCSSQKSVCSVHQLLFAELFLFLCLCLCVCVRGHTIIIGELLFETRARFSISDWGAGPGKEGCAGQVHIMVQMH